MKEIAVFGLGTLGKSLAISYSNMGGKVIAIDKSQEKVDEISDYVTFAIRADLTEENVIKGLGVSNVDVAIVTIGVAFYGLRKDIKKGKFDLELQAVEHEEITEFNPKAKIAVFLVLIGFALDIVAMYVFKLTGGDAAALLGGTAVLLIIIINIMNFNKKCFEQTCDNIIEGFVFGIKIFAAIIPIAAFFYMGEVAPITAVLGEVLPSGSQGLLSDMGVALSNTIPLNKFAVCSIQTVVGAITGLDGSGFSGISLVGSLANVFGTAVNGSVGALCALGQIAGIWTGGGCLVPWGLISAAAICGVSPIELAKRNLKPILIGFAVTTIVAVFII